MGGANSHGKSENACRICFCGFRFRESKPFPKAQHDENDYVNFHGKSENACRINFCGFKFQESKPFPKAQHDKNDYVIGACLQYRMIQPLDLS